jgi:hypothetical protein
MIKYLKIDSIIKNDGNDNIRKVYVLEVNHDRWYTKKDFIKYVKRLKDFERYHTVNITTLENRFVRIYKNWLRTDHTQIESDRLEDVEVKIKE